MANKRLDRVMSALERAHNHFAKIDHAGNMDTDEANLYKKIGNAIGDLHAVLEKKVVRCQDCRRILKKNDLIPVEQVKNLHQRVAPGEPMPVGECKHCGALAHEESR